MGESTYSELIPESMVLDLIVALLQELSHESFKVVIYTYVLTSAVANREEASRGCKNP